MYKMIPYRRAHLSPMMPSLFNDPMMREFFNDSSNLPTMNVDVHEEENEYVLEADLPGIDKKDINLEVKDGVLTISADVNNEKKEEKKNYVYSERRCGHVERSFNLEGIDENGIKADYDKGVLTINLPKLHEEPKPEGKKIAIGSEQDYSRAKALHPSLRGYAAQGARGTCSLAVELPPLGDRPRGSRQGMIPCTPDCALCAQDCWRESGLT